MITVKEAIEIRLKHNPECVFFSTNENTPDIEEIESYLSDNSETLPDDELQVIFVMMIQNKIQSKNMDIITNYKKIGYGE